MIGWKVPAPAAPINHTRIGCVAATEYHVLHSCAGVDKFSHLSVDAEGWGNSLTRLCNFENQVASGKPAVTMKPTLQCKRAQRDMQITIIGVDLVQDLP